MVNYKWELRKGCKKLKCPHCGQMRFVPYVASADHATLAGAEFGRCDRQDNCGYHCYPNGKSTDGIEVVELKPEPPLYFYPSAVQVDIRTPLFDYACKLLGVSNALAIWQRYRIGRDGTRTIFWQISRSGEVRAGKSIPYLPNGHRDKSDKYPANWLHKSPSWKPYMSGKELHQCYFGEHLLNEHPDYKVVIVESEKTAAFMSQLSSGWVWLASGGAQGLKNAEKNRALEGREVTLLPDHGQYWNWATIARENGWKINDTIEKNPTFSGCDVLDLVEAGCWKGLLKYSQLQ